MPVAKFNLTFGLVMIAGALFAGFGLSCDVSRLSSPQTKETVLATSTPKAVKADIETSKITPTMTPQTINVPIYVQNSGSGESGIVHELKPPVNDVMTQEPREVNPLNRIHIKKIDPNAVPSKDEALSPQALPKKKRLRKKKP